MLHEHSIFYVLSSYYSFYCDPIDVTPCHIMDNPTHDIHLVLHNSRPIHNPVLRLPVLHPVLFPRFMWERVRQDHKVPLVQRV